VVHDHLPPNAEGEALRGTLEPGQLTNRWWPNFSLNPSLLLLSAVRAVGGFSEARGSFEIDYGERYTNAGFRTAFFDTIACVHLGRRNADRGSAPPNAYGLNGVRQFG